MGFKVQKEIKAALLNNGSDPIARGPVFKRKGPKGPGYYVRYTDGSEHYLGPNKAIALATASLSKGGKLAS